MFSFNHLPVFARLDQYGGLWAIEPNAGHRLAELFAATDWKAHAPKDDAPPGPKRYEANGRSVAVIPISGTMMKQRPSGGGTSTIDVRRQLRQAAADSSISSILLSIDSPGGTVEGTQALANDVTAARHKKPVFGQVEDTGASAAYWAASQTDKLFAAVPTATIGSVGTMLAAKVSPADADGKSKAEVRVFRSGPLKAAGADGISDAQAADLQRWVDETQKHFTRAVKLGRRLDAAALEKVTQGGVFLAEEAKALGLIDGVQSIETTLAQMAKL